VNKKKSRRIFVAVRITFGLLVLLFISNLRAQSAADSGNRFLFVFETSSDMKKRAPSVEKEIDRALALDLDEVFSDGDTIGVWTFNDSVHTGEFPLQIWKSGSAATIAGNITAFVERQHYTRQGRYDTLMPLLDQVVENSKRLTVLIFCDGEQDIQGTPFDIGINQVFGQHLLERRKSKQPFVITLRSQLGNFVGCTVSFPPSLISLPAFPPLPEPTNAPPPVTNAPPPEPKPKPPQAPPLIIIWTNHPSEIPTSSPAEAEQKPVVPAPTQTPAKPPPVVTNLPTIATPSSNTASSTAKIQETNLPVEPPPVAALEPPATTFNPSSNQTVATTNTEQTTVAQTNIAAISTVNSPTGNGNMLIFGFGLLAGASVMAIMIWRRSRNKAQPSLITRSMEKK
jgi:hypothetical protein